MIKSKLDLRNLDDQEVIDLLKLVAARMAANGTAGPCPTSDPATKVAP